MRATIKPTNNDRLILKIEPTSQAEETLLHLFSNKIIKFGIQLANTESNDKALISLSLISGQLK